MLFPAQQKTMKSKNVNAAKQVQPMKVNRDSLGEIMRSPLMVNAAWIVRWLYMSLIAYPAAILFIGFLVYSFAGSNRGFAQAPHDFYSYISELPRTPATIEGNIVIRRCLDERERRESEQIKSPAICQSWGEEELSVDILADGTARTLAFFYSILVLVSSGLVFLFMGLPKMARRRNQ